MKRDRRKKVGPYRILDVLGQGGMGVVYVAEDERLGRRVAIKTLGEIRDEGARQRLWREARAAASLNHPGICQVFDVGEEKGELWIAMELLEGEGLDTTLKQRRLGVAGAVKIAIEILDPLAFLHQRGLVHRDLKPSNAFLTAHGLKLLDFGLTRPIDGPEDTRLTQTGAIVGTPHYMAPEQWRAQDIGPRSDLFSCGAILYEALSGRYAFPGDNPIDVFHACAFEEPPALDGAPGIEAVDAVVRRALAKDPDERFASAEEMIAALRDAMERVKSLEVSGGVGPRPAVLPATALQRFIALPFRLLRPDPEIEFLATTLPEAIGASLSGLRHLVVRSTRLAAAENGDRVDLKKLASEVGVDYALAGSLLSSGSRVRLNAELLQVPAGTVVWSAREEVPVGDLFELQDHLVTRVVEGLALPLSVRDRDRLRQDVPATARAYELYLRALHASTSTVSIADTLALRDLLRACVDEDPDFAPAWANYARICRIIAKYNLADMDEHLRLAGDGFARALELNPDSPLVHNLYTFYQLEELADSKGAMLRLLGRARERLPDADLFVGLVAACRFCGLHGASLAAHQRARRLDPQILSSAEHTYFQLGEYEKAAEVEAERAGLVRALAGAMLGDEARTIAALRAPQVQVYEGLERHFVEGTLAALEGRREDCERVAREVLELGMRDPEAIYFFARTLGRAGVIEPGLEAVERMVDRGFFSTPALNNDPWFDSLRGEPRFQAALDRAAQGSRDAADAYRAAEGERLLAPL